MAISSLNFPVTDIHRYLGWRLRDLGMPKEQVTATIISCRSYDASGCLALMRPGPWQVLIFGVVVALRVMLAVVDVWTSEVRLKSEMLLAGGWPFHA